MKYNNIDLQGIGELRNANFQNLSSAPTTNLRAGRTYFDTVSHTLYVYDGTEWRDALSQGGYTFINGLEVISGTSNVQVKLATGGNAGNVTFTADSNGLAGSVAEASTSTKGIIEIATDAEASTGTSETLAINPKQLKTAIDSAIIGGMKYMGVWTATGQTDYSSITLPVKAGYMYLVSGSATIGGIEWNTDDYLVINEDVAVGGTITDVKKIDNTEGSDIVRLNATQTLTNKTIDADDNTISDLELDNFKSGVVRTSTDGIRDASSAVDTSTVTEKAVATSIQYMAKVESFNNSALTESGGKVTWTISMTGKDISKAAVQVYEIGASTRTMICPNEVEIGTDTITIELLATANVAADSYQAVVIY